jgi:hypothetical protein
MTDCSKNVTIRRKTEKKTKKREERNEAIEEELMINQKGDHHPGIYTAPGRTAVWPAMM